MGYNTTFHRVVDKYMARYGFTVTITRKPSDGVYDPSTGDYTYTPVTFDATAIYMDYTLQSNGSTTVGDSLIQSGDKQLLIRPPSASTTHKGLKPNTDTITFDDVTYTIITFKEVNPTTQDAILWELYVRQ